MATSISNLYASQVFSEHPIALWSLDEDFSFINLLSASAQDISNWTAVGGSASLNSASTFLASIYPGQKTLPIDEDVYFIANSASADYTSISLPSYFTENDIDSEKRSISIGTWFLAPSTVSDIELWFNISGSTSYSASTSVVNSDPGRWTFANYTTDLAASASFQPEIRVNNLTQSTGIKTFINGLSVSQWSEIYSRETSGSRPEDITDVNLASLISTASTNYGVNEITPYGLNGLDIGYYITNKNKMLANNTSLPMVFGSGNITRINSPIDAGTPSIVLPGKNFLNEYGKYKNLTAEFWLRVYTDSIEPIKIFGALANEDGIYIEQEFITIRVGPYKKSHFIGKWYRPMLVSMRYSRTNVSLLINGDLVIDMDIDVDNIIFATSEQDWLGFFGNEKAYPFEIDSIAIYPYIVPEQIAKRRFVYGQAVQSPEEIVSDFKGESFFVDFPFAKYTSSMIYPDVNPWTAGFLSNLKANEKSLSFPDYSLPEFKISDNATESTTQFLKDNYSIQDEESAFIKMRPTEAYSQANTSIYFNSINPINDSVYSILGVFKTPTTLPSYSNKQNIMTFTNAIDSSKFTINISDSGVEYEFFNGSSSAQIVNYSASANQLISLGLNIEEIIKQNYSIIGNFFSNPRNISLSLGGYGGNIFDGKIFSLTFNNKMFTIKDLQDYVQNDGTIWMTPQEIEEFNSLDYIGNYTFVPINSYGEMIFDIGCSGYWEDSLPLSYFGKYVKNQNQSSYYDLDLIQFNIDIPSPITYQVSEEETNDPFKIKTFITLQDFEEVGKKTYSSYTQTEYIGASRVLDLQPQFSTLLKKFEIVDGTIIYPPKELIDFENYYLTVHMELKVRGILTKPVNVKRMVFNSLAYDESNEYKIGTRSGHPIIPFTRQGLNYDYKAKNPFVIYKESTPYLYLTSDSGISVAPYASASASIRGISFQMNDHESQDYKLTGMQFWMFYNKSKIISSTQLIGTIVAPRFSQDQITQVKTYTGFTDYYDLYLVPELNGKRGSLILYKNNEIYSLAKFFINGRPVSQIKITPLEWTSILISFPDTVDITSNSRTARFEVYEGILINNVAFFQQEFINYFSKLVSGIQWTNLDGELWSYPTQTLNNDGDPLSWGEWGDITITDITSQTGDSTFKTYLGLSEEVFDDTDTVVTESEGFDALTNVTWSSFIVKPV